MLHLVQDIILEVLCAVSGIALGLMVVKEQCRLLGYMPR